MHPNWEEAHPPAALLAALWLGRLPFLPVCPRSLEFGVQGSCARALALPNRQCHRDALVPLKEVRKAKPPFQCA